MAKIDKAGFLEQHVEKIVLAAAGIILIVALAYWGAGTFPRKIALSGGEYPPDQVAPALQQKLKRFEDKTTEIVPVPTFVSPDFATLYELPYVAMPGRRETPIGMQKNIPVPGNPPIITTPKNGGSQVKLINLAELMQPPAPGAPAVKIARETHLLPPVQAGGAPTLQEFIAGHGAAVYDFKDMQEAWAKTLAGRAIPRVLFLRVEVERQEIRPGGQLGPITPVDRPAFLVAIPNPLVAPAETPGTPAGANSQEAMLQQLVTPEMQTEIVEPSIGYPSILGPDGNPSTWMINKLRTDVSDINASDVELMQHPAVPPIRTVTPPANPSGGPSGGPSGVTPRSPFRQPGEMQSRERGRATYDTPADEPRTPTPARPPTVVAPPVVAPPVVRPPTVVVTPTPATPPVTPPPAVLPAQVIKIAAVPTLRVQLDAGKMEIWFHDMAGLKDGGTYSYRLRVAMYNPLFGQACAAPDAIRMLSLVSPWSQWSQPVMVESPTRFFLAGAFPNDYVVVRVETLRNGRRVSQDFKVRRGDPIGGVTKIEVDKQPVTVDFSTGATAVDLDFQRRLRLGGMAAGTTIELLYMDAAGKLRSRLLAEEPKP
jgi:hypothetical protein